MTTQAVTKKSLDADLQYYINNKEDVAVIVYALVKGHANPLKMDIESPAQNGLKSLFLTAINNDILRSEDLTVLPLSSVDERSKVLYHYDIPLPDELECLSKALGQQNEPEFDFNIHKLEDIKVLLICIGNAERQITLYKTMAPVNIFSRDGFFLMKSDTRLKEIKEDFFRVSGNFQIMKVGCELFVVDLLLIEKMFGFHDVIKKEAARGMQSISDMNIVTDMEVLHELINDIKYARKLTRVAKASPVINAGIDNMSIIQFCKTYPTLKGRIRFNDDETKISLDTKVSKDLFIKVLMDDFLTSQLTKFYYDSIAKDTLVTEIV
ncbi:anti-phage protein KwaB [Enterobacter roggenkampii]|uniref:anti-phage protein KwaB n=1 Tax=Enterobacter roggenkampii TaxID=1812935 RepID=UPI003510E069